MKRTNIRVTFCICADFLDHEKISTLMELTPNYVRHSNEVLKNGRIFGHDEWGIETNYEESLDVQEQLLKVVSTLRNKKNYIIEICREFSANCTFLITINVENGEIPAMGINTDFMKFGSEINAELVFDMCYY